MHWWLKLLKTITSTYSPNLQIEFSFLIKGIQVWTYFRKVLNVFFFPAGYLTVKQSGETRWHFVEKLLWFWSDFCCVLCFSFSSYPAGVETGGLPGGQEGPNQPDGCTDWWPVWHSHSHIQRRHRPVWFHSSQHQLLLRTEQEHLRSE